MVEQCEIAGAQLAWGAATDVGKVRSLNEDSMLAVPPVFVVADGMGGHDAGEVASALTVSRLATLAEGEPTSVELVSAEIQNINSLLRAAADGPSGSTMGTTGVGMVMVDNVGVLSWLVFNVGDSRAYVMDDDSLVQMSKDHSYVQELVDAGDIEPFEARVHPHRNVVTQALGADDQVHPDYWVRPVRPSERFLLCSDGLTGEVEDGVIAAVMSAGLPADQTAQELIELALANGGHDNVTAIVIDVVAVLSWEDPTTETRPGSRTAVRGTAVLDPPRPLFGQSTASFSTPDPLDQLAEQVQDPPEPLLPLPLPLPPAPSQKRQKLFARTDPSGVVSLNPEPPSEGFIQEVPETQVPLFTGSATLEAQAVDNSVFIVSGLEEINEVPQGPEKPRAAVSTAASAALLAASLSPITVPAELVVPEAHEEPEETHLLPEQEILPMPPGVATSSRPIRVQPLQGDDGTGGSDGSHA